MSNTIFSDKTIGEALNWFVGSGMDKETLQALVEEDEIQKQLFLQQIDTSTSV